MCVYAQAYLTNKYEKADQRVKRMDDYSGTVCKLMRDMDLSRNIGMEHFMKKVEALYCAACDMYVPMQPTFIEMHLKSPDHNYNRKVKPSSVPTTCPGTATSLSSITSDLSGIRDCWSTLRGWAAPRPEGSSATSTSTPNTRASSRYEFQE